MLLIDVSGSLDFGTVSRRSVRYGHGDCCYIAFSAIENNDKIGVIFFSDRIEKYIPPKKGRKHILYIIREMLDFHPVSTRQTSAATAYLTRVMKRRCTSFVISDFYDNKDFTREMEIANRKHDVVAIQVYDQRAKTAARYWTAEGARCRDRPRDVYRHVQQETAPGPYRYWMEREQHLR
jgi:uncharacterized protein (DUF58 family)